MMDSAIALVTFDKLKTLISGLEEKSREEYEFYINVCSEKITQHCGRTFIRKEFTEAVQSLVGDILVKNDVVSVVSEGFVKVGDKTLIFEGLDEPSTVTYESGYNLPNFVGQTPATTGSIWEDDDGILKEYDGNVWIDYAGGDSPEFTGEQPVIAIDGNIWQNSSGIMHRLEESVWVVYPSVVVPYTIQQATLAYLMWVQKQIASNHVGTVETRSGYSYEGTQLIIEKGMPSLVKEMLEFFVVIPVA